MNLCAKCIQEQDLERWIEEQNGPRGCDFCGRKDAPTVDFDELTTYMRDCLQKVWGYAIEQLPYESAEGGYQGRTWTTSELLYDECEIELPRDKDDLAYRFASAISEELWCDYDWLRLDEDDALRMSWEQFREVVKHERRFFFGHIEDNADRELLTPASLLKRLAKLVADFDLIRELPAGTSVYRARISNRRLRTPEDMGPPPADIALQSNRMNPPGVPMLYAAESRRTALLEVQAPEAFIGTFELLAPINILDLCDLPEVPGIFANAERWNRLALRFLHHFQAEVTAPVPRNQRIHIDFIPTQVITEFFRHVAFDGRQLLGIRYPSTVDVGGRNIVLFATQADMERAVEPEWGRAIPWIRMMSVRRQRAPKN